MVGGFKSFSLQSAREGLRPRQVTRNLGLLKLKSGSNKWTAHDFLSELKAAKRAGFEELEVDVSRLAESGLFPNVAVPICALMDVARGKTEFSPIGMSAHVEHAGLFKPYEVGAELGRQFNVLNKVWAFETSEDTFRLTREFVDELYKTVVVEAGGVLAALEWCLGEVLENVILHSEISRGYVMAQLHTQKRHVALSIVDLGRGIFESLSESGQYKPRTPQDAISLAIQEGVTRDKIKNQGNGLWGLHNAIRRNNGSLTIISGGGGMKITGSQSTKFKAGRYGFMGGGTLIDCQFDLDRPIDLDKVLGGYTPKPMIIVKNADEKGDIRYSLIDQKDGFGTREAGVRIRNEIVNLKAQTSGRVIIDFNGISVVTSSFADELLGRLYADLGPVNFSTAISLEGMSDGVRAVVERAMIQRMSTQLGN